VEGDRLRRFGFDRQLSVFELDLRALELLVFDICDGNGRRRRRLAGLTRLGGLAGVGRRLARCARRGRGPGDHLFLRRERSRTEGEAGGEPDGTRSVPATVRHSHLALFLAGAGAFAGAADFAGAALGAAFGGGGSAASGSSARFSTASRL